MGTACLVPAGICGFLLCFLLPTLLLGFPTLLPDSEVTAFPRPLDLLGTDQVLKDVRVKVCVWSEGMCC